MATWTLRTTFSVRSQALASAIRRNSRHSSSEAKRRTKTTGTSSCGPLPTSVDPGCCASAWRRSWTRSANDAGVWISLGKSCASASAGFNFDTAQVIRNHSSGEKLLAGKWANKLSSNSMPLSSFISSRAMAEIMFTTSRCCNSPRPLRTRPKSASNSAFSSFKPTRPATKQSMPTSFIESLSAAASAIAAEITAQNPSEAGSLKVLQHHAAMVKVAPSIRWAPTSSKAFARHALAASRSCASGIIGIILARAMRYFFGKRTSPPELTACSTYAGKKLISCRTWSSML
mmetsp:Transcript_27296/g.90736  ORF Transcript_27296/g.90736 Transcript_27296/m.90736 type:complete len:288 (-) Transcript_27296:1206-2069(-)